jgi:creatinine amidohydrolase/Fe(II)-dependent formamide hydrolase-like protein
MSRTLIALALLLATPAAAQEIIPAPDGASTGPDTVFVQELTWTEVAARVRAGTRSVIVPTGGTEQNGPHMVLGKHNFIIREASERIARELGNTLVAPVVAYVPEGGIDPPTGHMRYAGAITLPQEHFEALLEYTARGFALHGFDNVIFIGDSGGNQRGMAAVAEKLNGEWTAAGNASRVVYVPEYYRGNGFRDWLLEQGIPEDAIGRHAGVTDTSQLWYVAPEQIRPEARVKDGGFEGSGVNGDPTLASRELGEKGIELKVETTVRRVREMLAARSGE